MNARDAAAAAAFAAATSWLGLWWHQRLAHGKTSVNEQNLVLGLTWMDSGKLVVVPLALFLVCLVALSVSLGDSGRLGRAGFLGSVGALALVIVGAAMQFWRFEWGSYEEGFEEASVGAGGAVQAAASLVLAAALAAFAIAAVRRRALTAWIAPVLPISGLTTFWLTPTNVVPGVAWLGLAAFLVRRGREAP